MKNICFFIAALLVSFTSFAQPGAITGTFSVCVGNTTTLACTPAGGTWSSSNPSIASIGTSNGVVLGNAAGVVTITYNAGSVGFSTASFTVNPAPATIACPTSGCMVCVGSTVTLADATPGGTWSSGTPGVATIGSASGIATGISPGVTLIAYTLPTGCFVTTLLSVNAVPGAITGTTQVCAGSTTTLSAPGSGTWSSGTPAVATVGSANGVVTGVAAGTSVISYTISGCSSTTIVTVNPIPGPILGTSSGFQVCVGSTLPLGNAVTGGTWTSSPVTIATIGSLTGVVTGVAPGVATIVYTLAGGCFVTANVTVNAIPGPITGTATVCVGATTTLSAPGSGTWSSGTPAVATVGSASGIVTGVAAGTSIISYTVSGCSTTTIVTVNPIPGPITGPASGLQVCVGSTLSLSNAVTGGTWTSSPVTIATIGSASGVVTGIAPGVATIVYTLPGGCFVSRNITVNAIPGPITGTSTVCAGSTTTLSAPGSGTWSSGTPAVATVGSANGVVTGVAAGTSVISYTVSGCSATTIVTVNPMPGPIGPTTGLQVCVGSTVSLSNAVTGGTWTSSPTTIATIGSLTGVVTGVSPGVATIVYTLPGGCFVTANVTVNPAPGPITGITSLCSGSSTTLSATPSGGTWSSSGVAAVGSTGIVFGAAPGTATVTYTLGGCFVTTTVTVNPLPTISGGPTVCVGTVITLTGTPAGGTWASGNPTIATVGSSTGVVTGVSPGIVSVVYTLPTGCSKFILINVILAPPPIVGPSSGNVICAGNTLTLTNTSPGGTWGSSDVTVATVGSNTGVVTGVGAGTATITYSFGAGCFSTTTVTVNPSPLPITGPNTVCLGSSITLSSATPAGTWSASGGSAIIGSASGVVTGTAIGVNTITYMLATGCFVTYTVSVNPIPSTITGLSTVCVGGSITLFSSPAGGTWSSSIPAVATIGAATGIITAIAPGVTSIAYTVGGCIVTTTITVTPLPAPITGPAIVCIGYTITLADLTPGGTWTISGGTATINPSSGVVSGAAVGTASVTYTLSTGCFVTRAVTVSPLPCAGVGGVETEIKNSGDVALFPNPAFDKLTIKMSEDAYSSVIITNNIGQVMMEQKLAAITSTVDITTLPAGIYYAVFKGERGTVAKHFVKE